MIVRTTVISHPYNMCCIVLLLLLLFFYLFSQFTGQ